MHFITHTANLLSNSKQLLHRQFVASDAPHNRPHAFVFHCFSHDIAEVPYRDEADSRTFSAFEHNSPAVVEIKLVLERVDMLRRLVWRCVVIHKHPRLEEAVLEDL